MKNLLVGNGLLLMGSVEIEARATPKWEGVRYIIRKINPFDICIVSLSQLKQSWKSEGLFVLAQGCALCAWQALKRGLVS